MLTIPVVLVLGFLAFGLVKWGKQKATGVVVGVLFGLTLAGTPFGAPLVRGLQSLGQAIVAAIAGWAT